MPRVFLSTGWQQQTLEFESVNSCRGPMSVASLQLENVWQDMVWELLGDTQLIGCSREQKLNSLNWALNSLAGAPQSHPFLVELESANCSADRKEDHEPGFRAASCRQQRASFLLFVAISHHLLRRCTQGLCPPPGESALLGAPLAGSLCRPIPSVLRCFRPGMWGCFTIFHMQRECSGTYLAIRLR